MKKSWNYAKRNCQNTLEDEKNLVLLPSENSGSPNSSSPSGEAGEAARQYNQKSKLTNMNINEIMAGLEAKHPGEKEYLQAVKEVLMSVEEVYNQHPEFEKARIIERMVEPDRIFTFRVTWVDDKGEVQNNIGYRVQFNNAIGPYKGGIRFHASVNLSILAARAVPTSAPAARATLRSCVSARPSSLNSGATSVRTATFRQVI